MNSYLLSKDELEGNDSKELGDIVLVLKRLPSKWEEETNTNKIIQEQLSDKQ